MEDIYDVISRLQGNIIMNSYYGTQIVISTNCYLCSIVTVHVSFSNDMSLKSTNEPRHKQTEE